MFGPRPSKGVPGVGSGRKSREQTLAETLRPDSLQIPHCWFSPPRLQPTCRRQPGRLIDDRLAQGRQAPASGTDRFWPAPIPHPNRYEDRQLSKRRHRETESPNWVPQGSRAGVFRPGFQGLSAESHPRDPLRSPGPSTCTKSQPRRPVLRQFGDERRISRDCLQVPSFSVRHRMLLGSAGPISRAT